MRDYFSTDSYKPLGNTYRMYSYTNGFGYSDDDDDYNDMSFEFGGRRRKRSGSKKAKSRKQNASTGRRRGSKRSLADHDDEAYNSDDAVLMLHREDTKDDNEVLQGDEDGTLNSFGFGVKRRKKSRRGSAEGKRALRLMHDRKISLKKAWSIVKGKKKPSGKKSSKKRSRKGSADAKRAMQMRSKHNISLKDAWAIVHGKKKLSQVSKKKKSKSRRTSGKRKSRSRR